MSAFYGGELVRQTCPEQIHLAAYSQLFPKVCFVLRAIERKVGLEKGERKRRVAREKAKEQCETESKPRIDPRWLLSR